MASVCLPEKCLNDSGRGKTWLLTAVAHFGGQEGIDEVESAIKTATLKGVSWKKIMNLGLLAIVQMVEVKGDASAKILEFAEAIDSIPAPAVVESAD